MWTLPLCVCVCARGGKYDQVTYYTDHDMHNWIIVSNQKKRKKGLLLLLRRGCFWNDDDDSRVEPKQQVIPYPPSGGPLSSHLLKRKNSPSSSSSHPNWLRTLMLEGQLIRRSRQAPTGVNTNTHRRPNNHTTCPWNYDDNTTGTIKRQQTNTHTHTRPKVVHSFVCFFLTHQFTGQK